MDQQGHQFVPHLLVVQAGTEVTFPNSDNVSHHVYSFSPTKPFELPLYKGDVYPPVTFEKAGIVVVGCNIHDSMLGYIRRRRHAALRRDERARRRARSMACRAASTSSKRGHRACGPRSYPPAQHVAVGDGDAAARNFASRAGLAPAHQHGSSSLTWERY